MSALDTFFSAWAETDADRRTALIAQSCTTDINYADPRSGGTINGVAAVSDYVGMFSANAPGWAARVVSGDAVGNTHRALVAFGGPGPDGTDMSQHGTYFAHTDDGGKLTMICGFVGVLTPQ